MKRTINSGVKLTEKGYAIDYTYNYPEDLIHIQEPQLNRTVHDNGIYYFGYKFNDGVSSKDRTHFINSVKQINDEPLSDSELDQFIKRPLKDLDKEVNLQHIDCMIYPLSKRSPLVSKIVRAINDMTSHEMRRCSFEFVKSAPTEIGFDFESFESDHGDEQGYKQMLKYVNEELLPKLHNLDYFSIAQNVKSKYRNYITGFLNFADQESADRFARLQGANILVVDDINTTGSTLNEILRKLTDINNSSNIYVYTLIGR